MANWRDNNGGGGAQRLMGNGIPMIIPSSGSIGNNGALSGITALPTQFASCYMYFPANAISAGSAAGFYYVVMSSTSAGTIYNNTYTSGTPTIPASPNAFITAGPGAYTQTTAADITMLSASIPGGLLGTDGTIGVKVDISHPENTNDKICKLTYGGATVTSVPMATATVETQLWSVHITGRGAVNKQYTHPTNASRDGTYASSVNEISVNSAAAQTMAFTGQLAVATDYIILHGLKAFLEIAS